MNRYFFSAGIGSVLLLAAAAAWGLAAWELNKTATETALLETENSAARVMAAMQQPAIWSNQLVQSKKPPPAALWGLERWPQGGEVFFVVRDTDSFLVRRASAGEDGTEKIPESKEAALEFAPIGAKELFKRTMGSQKNVEWLLANAANRSETSLATIESGEATNANSEANEYFAPGKQISAAVAVPGTNTILRQFFALSYGDVLVSPVFWLAFGWVAFAVIIAFIVAKFGSRFSRLQPHQHATTQPEEPVPQGGLTDFEEFLARLRACYQSEFVKDQCVVLISPDNLATKSHQKRETILNVMARELAHAGIHGPVATRLASKTSSSSNDEAPLLFAIYCPHFDTSRALAFAEYCRTRLNSRPEMVFGSPQTTFSAAVAELAVEEHAQSPEVFQQIITDLFASAALTLRRIQENDGNATGLAGDPAADSRRCS